MEFLDIDFNPFARTLKTIYERRKNEYDRITHGIWIISTVLKNAEILLEPNKFPYYTPKNIDHYILWSLVELDFEQIKSFMDSQNFIVYKCWIHVNNPYRSVDIPHYTIFLSKYDKHKTEEIFNLYNSIVKNDDRFQPIYNYLKYDTIPTKRIKKEFYNKCYRMFRLEKNVFPEKIIKLAYHNYGHKLSLKRMYYYGKRTPCYEIKLSETYLVKLKNIMLVLCSFSIPNRNKTHLNKLNSDIFKIIEGFLLGLRSVEPNRGPRR